MWGQGRYEVDDELLHEDSVDLEPPRAMLRMAAKRSARKYKKEQTRK